MKKHFSLVLLGVLLLAGVAQAQVADNSLALPAAPISADDLGGCTIINLQGAITSGFLSWNAPGGGIATLVDPSATGGAGDPGCGTGTFDDMDFLIDSVGLDLADESAFGTGTGIGDFTYTVSIHAFATPGDQCGGPGAALWTSDPQVINGDGSGQYFPLIPVGITVSGPFFVFWTLDGLSNPAETTTLLWDSVARPLCHQWVTQDGGASFVDFTDFFTMGDTGWTDIAVFGDFVPRGTILDVPTLGQYGLAGLIAALALLGAVAIRRRMS